MEKREGGWLIERMISRKERMGSKRSSEKNRSRVQRERGEKERRK